MISYIFRRIVVPWRWCTWPQRRSLLVGERGRWQRCQKRKKLNEKQLRMSKILLQGNQTVLCGAPHSITHGSHPGKVGWWWEAELIKVGQRPQHQVCFKAGQSKSVWGQIMGKNKQPAVARSMLGGWSSLTPTCLPHFDKSAGKHNAMQELQDMNKAQLFEGSGYELSMAFRGLQETAIAF